MRTIRGYYRRTQGATAAPAGYSTRARPSRMSSKFYRSTAKVYFRRTICEPQWPGLRGVSHLDIELLRQHQMDEKVLHNRTARNPHKVGSLDVRDEPARPS